MQVLLLVSFISIRHVALRQMSLEQSTPKAVAKALKQLYTASPNERSRASGFSNRAACDADSAFTHAESISTATDR